MPKAGLVLLAVQPIMMIVAEAVVTEAAEQLVVAVALKMAVLV